MTRSRRLAFLCLALAVTTTPVAFAGDTSPTEPVSPVSPVSPVQPTPGQPAPATPAPAARVTKTATPVQTIFAWLAAAANPATAGATPTTPDAERAWRQWFDGGKDVPLAAMRDALVADGWTADRFVSYFQAVKARTAKAGCACKAKAAAAAKELADAGSEKDDGCCKGTGVRADGKPCCGSCGGAKKDPTPAAVEPSKESAPAPAPVPANAEPPKPATAAPTAKP